MIPSEFDAYIVCLTVNGEKGIGFLNRESNKLQVMSVIHFELLLESYMKTYVKPEVKN